MDCCGRESRSGDQRTRLDLISYVVRHRHFYRNQQSDAAGGILVGDHGRNHPLRWSVLRFQCLCVATDARWHLPCSSPCFFPDVGILSRGELRT